MLTVGADGSFANETSAEVACCVDCPLGDLDVGPLEGGDVMLGMAPPKNPASCRLAILPLCEAMSEIGEVVVDERPLVVGEPPLG